VRVCVCICVCVVKGESRVVQAGPNVCSIHSFSKKVTLSSCFLKTTPAYAEPARLQLRFLKTTLINATPARLHCASSKPHQQM